MNHTIDTFESAPVPTPAQIKSRTSLIGQAWKFVVLNLKMMEMVRKGSH